MILPFFIANFKVKIVDTLPRTGLIGGVGKIADMVWIREVFEILISVGL